MKKFKKLEKKLENAQIIECDVSVGLTQEQVNQRIKEKLVNKMPKRVTKTYGQILFDNFVNFFNILLFAIAALMIVAQIEFISFMFLFILGFNIVIGIIQDINARRLVDKLRVVTDPKVNVLRGGRLLQIAVDQVVLSDIIILKTGDQIICDGIILDGMVEVNESLLTGESTNIDKKVNDIVLSGSFITGGTAKMRVDKVGRANYAESLQEQAKAFKRPQSEIIKSLRKVFKVIGVFVIVLGAALFITYGVQGKLAWPEVMNGSDFQTSVSQISGSLVSMLPTGMYLLTSVTLAVGVIRLAKKRMLVQELYCIEMLARVDTLCLDKTGTITDGTMLVKDLIPLGKADKADLESALYTLVLATADTNATANAITAAYNSQTALPYQSATAFNSSTKYSSVMLKDGRSIVLGASEFILKGNAEVKKLEDKYAKQGLRVIAIAQSKKAIKNGEKLDGLIPLGIIVLQDHIRDDAAENIAWFKNNGVNIKIISGDNAISVSEIAKRVGVENADLYVSLEGMSLEDVASIANKYTVFGRVSPEQKEVIISSLREAKHVVAMTGDGVNDILALKKADCSIAMASGSAAARNVAHIVALDSNFSQLPAVVAEGRRVINNLQRTCSLFLVKTLFAMILTVSFTIGMWTSSDIVYPFITRNMYIWEFASIGMASFFLALQPNNERLKPGFINNILVRAVPAGLVQSLIVGMLFCTAIFSKGSIIDIDTATTMSVLSFSIFSFVILIRICYPFDIYRVVLVSALAVIAGILIIVDVCFPGLEFFGVDYTLITGDNWWIFVCTIAAATGVYYGLDCLSKYLNKKYLAVKARGETK